MNADCSARSAQLLNLAEPLHGRLHARRARLAALDTELDDALDQTRVFQLRRFPQLRIHGDVRETGNGVDLVHEQAILPALEKKIDARESGCADGLECS